tara:strand:+ start:354 stop:1463 length:1110 start_codon:yes stop_codon:yes gene_type:complete
LENFSIDALVIGAGLIGLACGKYLSEKGLDTVVIDKAHRISEGVSSRNSGVIHSGIYYEQDSLKARLCVRGKNLLYKYAKERDVPFKQIGKIIVGSNLQKQDVENLYYRGRSNGLNGLELLTKNDLKQLEPNITSDLGIYVRDTGIIDAARLAVSLQADIERNQSFVILNTQFLRTEKRNCSLVSELETHDSRVSVQSKYVVVACGLASFETAKKIRGLEKLSLIKKLKFVKGHYYKINGEYPFNHLVYPLPSKYGLGIHSCIDLDGKTRFGPDSEITENIDYDFSLNSQDKFIKAISNYWPEIRLKKIYRDFVGVRPTLPTSGGRNDFSILTEQNHGIENLVFLQGIDSPGLTSSLAIAEYISNYLQK